LRIIAVLLVGELIFLYIAKRLGKISDKEAKKYSLLNKELGFQLTVILFAIIIILSVTLLVMSITINLNY
jgi:hypothetical protein